jgi:hypothetical protein
MTARILMMLVVCPIFWSAFALAKCPAPGIIEAREQAGQLFLGEVLGVHSKKGGKRTTFLIQRSWKGQQSGRIDVFQPWYTRGDEGQLIRKRQRAECWGSNDHGQLGDNTIYDRWTPVPVTGLPYDKALQPAIPATANAELSASKCNVLTRNRQKVRPVRKILRQLRFPATFSITASVHFGDF